MPQALAASPVDLPALARGLAASDPKLAEALSQSVSPVVALTQYGLARYMAGDFARAAEILRPVADASPGQPLAWNNLALALVALGQHQAAIDALRTSLNLDAAQPAIWTSLAGALLQLNLGEEAEAACTQAIAFDANNAAPWQIRALARAGREDFAGAAAAFARTIELAGESATLRANLATMLFQCGQFHEAVDNFDRAIALEPAAAIADMARLARFVVAAVEDDMDAARAIYPDGNDPGTDIAFKTALLYLDRAGQRAASARVAELWAVCRPDNKEARHLRDAALARPTDRTPAALVAQHFDALADEFDDKLVRRLGYDGPGQMLRLIAPHVAPAATLEVLDAGCGTGLCAAHLRPYARHLAGVDLSARMLDKARQRSLYDDLQEADLIEFVSRESGRWDLIVAADCFPYLGVLEPVFDAAAAALKQGGWFAFSTEAAETDGFVLRTSGRYGHGRDYIAALANGRFEIVERFAAMLRREGGRPLDGDYFLLRRL